ncbi:hypothetical protein [Nocardioides zhouii]|uniref:Uncharacterized protein n=1 Tax=Nocardioides zhouii TaxID=1168729 RepID=A0A4Q2T673_9ACTN|nr:hypothetical protein [Nocardioides zhouii]RYC14202.1 hypothetical protein EUA94_02510 [Nocardioides zhouii]
MYDDSYVDALFGRLRSPFVDVRALAADEATDRVSAWGNHSYTASQAARITGALVDALARETAAVSREATLNAIATLVEWDLAPIGDIRRAIRLPRPQDHALADYWQYIAECAERQD